MDRRIVALATLVAVLIVSGCAPTSSAKSMPAPTPAPAAGTKNIVLGLIYPEEPAKRIKQWLPFADKLASGLGKFGISGGDVVIAADKGQMADALTSGKVDLYFDSPYDAMTVMDRAGAQPLMRRWKGGQGTYSSVIFATSSSGLKSLTDLKGRVLGLQDAGSTSGFVLPVTHLLKSGVKVTREESRTPGPDQVGYFFTGKDDKTIQGVISGDLAAGAVDDTRLKALPDDVRASMVVLAQTESVSRGLVVARPGIDPELLGAVKSLLREMSDTPGNKDLLDSIDANRFDEFPEGTGAAVAQLRELQKLIQNR